MKSIFSKALRKLNNRSGESLAEVLVSVLISAVALVMLASMITSSTSMIEKSRASMKDNYAAANALIDAEPDQPGKLDVKIDADGYDVIYSPNTDPDKQNKIPVKYSSSDGSIYGYNAG